MPARGSVVAAVLERRLGQEQVRFLGDLRQRLRGAAVARVAEDAVAPDAEPEGLDLVVLDGDRRHLEPLGRLERHARLVFRDVERALEHVLAAEQGQRRPQLLAASRRQPELRLRQRLARPEEAAPDPGHEVAPVVEMEVGDRDRLDGRPGLALAQLCEHARPAVEQQAVVDEVARAGSAGVRPGGGRADDREVHRRILPTPWPARSEW
jgi:hypothetical protein